MEEKYALSLWYNLKGHYDVVIFENLETLKKFRKEYTSIFTDYLDEKITYDEFDYLTESLYYSYFDNVIKVIDEIYWRDIKEDENGYYILDNIDGEDVKVIILDRLDYGY